MKPNLTVGQEQMVHCGANNPSCKKIFNFKFKLGLENTTDVCLSSENKINMCISSENKTDMCISSETKTYKCISPTNDTNAESNYNNLLRLPDKEIYIEQNDNVLNNQGPNELPPITNYPNRETEIDVNPIKNDLNSEH
jgi:hypothetical protein